MPSRRKHAGRHADQPGQSPSIGVAGHHETPNEGQLLEIAYPRQAGLHADEGRTYDSQVETMLDRNKPCGGEPGATTAETADSRNGRKEWKASNKVAGFRASKNTIRVGEIRYVGGERRTERPKSSPLQDTFAEADCRQRSESGFRSRYIGRARRGFAIIVRCHP